MLVARVRFSEARLGARLRLLCCSLLLVLLALPRVARAEPADPFDVKIMAELEAESPEAAGVFRRANEARERNDLEGAATLYRELRRLAPSFFHATRRLCGVEMELGHREAAIALCREALAAAETPQNLAALGSALAVGEPSSAELDEAGHEVRRAMGLAPDDMAVHAMACEVALHRKDVALLRLCATRLDQIAPTSPATHFFGAIAALNDERFDDARASLERARDGGLPPESYARLSAVIDEATPFYYRVWSIGWRVTLAWLVSFGSLLGLGSLLSALALRAANRGPEGKGGEVQGVERTLRRLYRGVIWACCLFYYVSMPLVLLAVLGVGGGLIYGFFAIGQIPVKLVAIIGLLTVSTVAAILKSLFVRGRDVDPGARLPLREHPQLDAVLDEVAQKIGTRRVDTVYLTPGTELAVMERGTVMRRVRGQAERCLILGAGVFKGMKVLELKSVLAHEYGHFRNEDTAGGGFALFVRRSLHTFILNLAKAGAAAWYNPAWWFVRGFQRVFLIVSQGASRLQEVLADRWAVHAYGSAAFERGLTHVITRSVRFDAHIDATLNEVVKEKLPLRNLYAYKPGEVKDVESAVDEAINAEPSPYDSHPSPRHRVGWAHDLDVPPPPAGPEDDKPVWSLFSSRKALERQMTDEIRARVVNALGVKIPREEEESEEE